MEINSILNAVWEEHLLGEFFTERKERATGNEELLSVTIANGVIRQSDSEKRNISSDDKSNYKIVKKGDIAYNTMRMWQGSQGVSNWDGIVSPAYTIITPKEGVNTKFFSILFKTHYALNLFTNYSQGLSSDNWNLKFSEFAKLKIKVPSKEVQQKIVELMEAQDEYILNQKIYLTALINKRNGIVQQIFSEKLKYKYSSEAWEYTELSEILFERKEKSHGNEEVYSVSVSKGLVNQIEHLGRSYASENTSKYKVVHPGDVIYTKSPTGDFKWGIVKQSTIDKKVIISPLYGVFTPSNNSIGYILDAYFSSSSRAHNYLITQIRKGAKNTINVSNDEFLAKGIYLPIERKEQDSIAKLIYNLDLQIKKWTEKVDRLYKIKKGLMQIAFSNIK